MALIDSDQCTLKVSGEHKKAKYRRTKALEARLAELRPHLAKLGREYHKLLPVDFAEQATEQEKQALEVIGKTEAAEIQQIEAALKRIAEGTFKPGVPSSTKEARSVLVVPSWLSLPSFLNFRGPLFAALSPLSLSFGFPCISAEMREQSSGGRPH